MARRLPAIQRVNTSQSSGVECITMVLDDLEMFFLLYLYVTFAMAAGNMQRAIILSCIARNRALQGQLLAMNRRHDIQRRRARRRLVILVSWTVPVVKRIHL